MSEFLGIHHASLIVSDLAESRYFYESILGLEVDRNRPDLSFDGLWLNINASQQIHLLCVKNPDPAKRPKHGGRDRHTALKIRKIISIQTRLDEHKITYTLSSSGRKALFFRDPDGNTLEVLE
jgi:glyoxylase I family protein